jgi:hypothetical protein
LGFVGLTTTSAGPNRFAVGPAIQDVRELPMRIDMRQIFKCLLILITTSIAQAGETGWTFIWVSSGSKGYQVVQGKAEVFVHKGKLKAKLVSEDGNEYKVIGLVNKKKVAAKFTVMGSDYFINSPFTGTYTSRRWARSEGSSGRESVSLSDGWNFIGLSHELP